MVVLEDVISLVHKQQILEWYLDWAVEMLLEYEQLVRRNGL